MPESVPVAQQDPEVAALIERIRADHPGLLVGVQSPTADERADTGAAADYQEIVIDPFGPERCVIPLHGDGTYEVWRVPVVDMPGAGELLDSHTHLHSAVDAALAAADQQQEPTAFGDGDRRLSRPDEQAPAVAGDRGPEQAAVSNVWRSDLTAAAKVQAQLHTSAEPGHNPPGVEPLRDEEIELLERVDPGREVGGRMDWSHRRPERAAEPTPGRQMGRSRDGSD